MSTEEMTLEARLEAAEQERSQFEQALREIRQCPDWCQCTEIARKVLGACGK